MSSIEYKTNTIEMVKFIQESLYEWNVKRMILYSGEVDIHGFKDSYIIGPVKQK